MGEFTGALSAYFEVQNALIAEFYEVIHVMEENQKMELTNVWLECDSSLVCASFIVRTSVPWMLRSR